MPINIPIIPNGHRRHFEIVTAGGEVSHIHTTTAQACVLRIPDGYTAREITLAECRDRIRDAAL